MAAQNSAGSGGVEMKRTLSLTGVTVNAMALIAPGAFLWTTFQVQAAQTNGPATTAFDMVTGLIAALILAFLTAISYSELANAYPEAGTGSSYYFAEAAFLSRERHEHFARLAKFIVGWVSHLYYWIYPGIMVAFSATLIGYIFSVAGITLGNLELVIIAALFALINGYIAFRGITGSTLTAIVINVIQLVSLVIVSILAIIFRLTHPSIHYAHASFLSVVTPHNYTNLLYQSTIAILLLVGFESITSLGAEAKNPKRDIRRGILLSLVIQGLFAYLFEYMAANFFIGDQLVGKVAGKTVTGYDAAAASAAPLGDMIRVIGDKMLGGTGTALMLIVAVTVVLALIGTTLACLNTGVRISYAMARDRELPSVIGLLHGEYATPHWGIWILVLVSAVFGAWGVINVDHLTQITLASNTGTFLVYGFTNLIAFVAFLGRPGMNVFRHLIVPFLGALANLLMLIFVVKLSISAGGSTQTDTVVALAMVGAWIVIGAIWMIANSASQGKSMIARPSSSS
jgi:basic amino acid/polyamine antiporter, APA family